MSNRLSTETSPYLLQHSQNPVNWYPWGDEAFNAAKSEDKPVFLSIGYSTCHWCHVMAHESFEDAEIAQLLNDNFISIKVDREERPDIDSVYMAVCQAFTGSGGWPTSIFLTPEQKPFFAGTYFPKTTRLSSIGFKELLTIISKQWHTDRKTLLESADEIIDTLNKTNNAYEASLDEKLLKAATMLYKRAFDNKFGGFGDAPKFPAAHNLLFLLTEYEKHGGHETLKMAETSLVQMYRGGLFDHIGFGFCRYSTDRYFLVPHFEKMLYDNALLMMAYCKAYSITTKPFYRNVAEKIAIYAMREMTSINGAFFSAQDADSDGVEGKYYTFTPQEIISILGSDVGDAFCSYYDITRGGNFEGKSIPNLLRNDKLSDDFDKYMPVLYNYRLHRTSLHLDDKILTSWNSLMIAAMCCLYRISSNETYLHASKKAQQFIADKLCEEDTLYVSYSKGKRSIRGFIDDYANYTFALIALYEATLESNYLQMAQKFCDKAIKSFYDEEHGGFYIYSSEHEQLIMRSKETYDGAMPSGNSMMAYNLVRLSSIVPSKKYDEIARKQLNFLSLEAGAYPIGYSMFLLALSDYVSPPTKITVVPKNDAELFNIAKSIPLGACVREVSANEGEYTLKNDKTTFYICKGNRCLPPVNHIDELE